MYSLLKFPLTTMLYPFPSNLRPCYVDSEVGWSLRQPQIIENIKSSLLCAQKVGLNER